MILDLEAGVHSDFQGFRSFMVTDNEISLLAEDFA